MGLFASLDTELLDRVKAHCKEHCAWLKNDKAVSEYALECLSSKAYEVWQRNGKFD